jgi:hypothetical protein
VMVMPSRPTIERAQLNAGIPGNHAAQNLPGGQVFKGGASRPCLRARDTVAACPSAPFWA